MKVRKTRKMKIQMQLNQTRNRRVRRERPEADTLSQIMMKEKTRKRGGLLLTTLTSP